jgi:succinate-semialdehyde dehydrogenase/glutarate-semialdehyde dehydrogenase
MQHTNLYIDGQWRDAASGERFDVITLGNPAQGVGADDRAARRLRRLITLENGKAGADAKGEATYAAEFFRWFAEEAVRADG